MAEMCGHPSAGHDRADLVGELQGGPGNGAAALVTMGPVDAHRFFSNGLDLDAVKDLPCVRSLRPLLRSDLQLADGSRNTSKASCSGCSFSP
jgi:hypothetical protein